MGVIYRITCVENKKFYIGSTVNKNQRWARHRKDLREARHPNRHMQAAWTAHGEAAFLFEVLEEVEDPIALLQREQHYLDQHAGKDYCFNWAKFADAPMRGVFGAANHKTGTTVPPEVRVKISASLTGENNPRWGKPVPPDVAARIAESNRKYPHRERKHTPEAIDKIRAASLGRPVSEETRKKRSEALLGHEVPPDVRMRISQTLSGAGNFWYGKKRPESFSEKVRKKVAATHTDGTTRIFPSIKALREEFGVTPTTVNRALKSVRPVLTGKLAGWTLAYADGS